MAYPYWCRKDPSVAQFNRWYELAAGWPFRCLWKAQAEYEPLEGAIPLPDPDGLSSIWPGQSMRGLPIRPIWPGLIGDSLIWAAITLSATLTTRTALRRRRLRRGLCPHCSYNRLHNYSTPCPECGALREP